MRRPDRDRIARLFGTALVLTAGLGRSHRAEGQQVPSGFRVELLYRAPDIEHPSAVTCDDEGNLFVGEDPMDMRGPSTEPIDRVLLVRWDARGGPPIKTVFCDKLSAVFGLLWHDGALYVMNAPNYTRLRDLDGDGVADERIELADSFGHPAGAFGLNNHVPTGMRIGMDGFVYVALGDKGLPRAVGRDGSSITVEGGGVFRMRPDATQLEIVSRGIRNNMDVAVDAYDNLFGFDNDDDYGWWMRIVHHVPTGYYGYPYDYRSRREPFLPPIGEFGAGTACGGACYLESAWPETYRGAAFFCDFGERKVECYRMSRRGATFEGAVEDFLVGEDGDAFRPIDLCFSPDGRHLYVADWNEASGGRPESVGRLFRVTYSGDGVAPEPPRARDGDPIDACVRSLGHPARSERLRAQQRLAVAARDAVEPVETLLRDDVRPLVRIHAIWTMHALMDRIADYDASPRWIAALEDGDADVRCQAARALGVRRVRSATEGLERRLADPEAAVRMQAAIALGRIGGKGTADALFAALGEPDPFARFTMVEALRAIADWSSALDALRHGDAESRARIIGVLRGVYAIEAVRTLDGWFQESPDAIDRAAIVRALARVYRHETPYAGGWWGGKAAGGPPPRRPTLFWEGSPTVLAVVTESLVDDEPRVRTAAIEASEDLGDHPFSLDVLRIALTDPDPNVRRAAIGRMVATRDIDGAALLVPILTDTSAPLAVRESVLRAIVTLDAAAHRATIGAIAGSEGVDASLAVVALESLAGTSGDAARDVALKRLTDPQPVLRAKAIEILARCEGDAPTLALIPMLDDSDPAIRQAAAVALPIVLGTAGPTVRTRAATALCDPPDAARLAAYLRTLVDTEPSVRAAARDALVALAPAVREPILALHERDELTPPVREELKRLFAPNSEYAFLRDGRPAKRDPEAYAKYAMENGGDAERGRQLFENTKGVGCAKCHRVGASREDRMGPDLLGVGAKYSRRELVRSVLEPSSRILEDFEMSLITTSGGAIHQGLVRNVTPERIELVTPDGMVVAIATEDVEDRRVSSLSPMPNGLIANMSLTDFADLIAYLESLRHSRGDDRSADTP